MTRIPETREDPIGDGGPAFPRPTGMFENEYGAKFPEPGDPGMSLRDWFAGQALAGTIASYAHPTSAGSMTVPSRRLAEYAYTLADAMIEARSAKAEGRS